MYEYVYEYVCTYTIYVDICEYIVGKLEITLKQFSLRTLKIALLFQQVSTPPNLTI